MSLDEYFTPDISDIHVGYECEFWKDPSKDEWIPYIIQPILGEWGNLLLPLGIRSLRVPYLTKEQIEGEGWSGNATHLSKGTYQLYINDKNLHIVDHSGDTFFNGECKDINTFRYISKLLGI